MRKRMSVRTRIACYQLQLGGRVVTGPAAIVRPRATDTGFASFAAMVVEQRNVPSQEWPRNGAERVGTYALSGWA